MPGSLAHTLVDPRDMCVASRAERPERFPRPFFPTPISERLVDSGHIAHDLTVNFGSIQKS